MQSAGVTATVTATVTSVEEPTSPSILLRLHAELPPAPQGVRWADDTVDNEGLGRRSSKKCCIFHKRRAYNEESSSEDSSGSGSSQ